MITENDEKMATLLYFPYIQSSPFFNEHFQLDMMIFIFRDG